MAAHSVTERLEGVVVPPLSLELAYPVWGIDPSTLRISVARLVPDDLNGSPLVRVSTLSLPRGDFCRRLAEALVVLGPWLRDLVDDAPPGLVWVEEPFGGGQARVHPSSNRILGVLLAVLGAVLPPRCGVELVGPTSWKAAALGKGRGFAKPPEYLTWARSVGYAGLLEDEAAAIGVATAAGISVSE